MMAIKFEDGEVQVDAAVISKGLGIGTSAVQPLLGRSRLTFLLDNRRFRIIISETGQIVRRSAIDFGDRALPAALRKPAE